MNQPMTKTLSPDFIVFSDGSGYKDGYGGWCCVVSALHNEQRMFRMGAVVGTTVDRMEMTALLEGLQLVDEMRNDHPKAQGDIGRCWHPVVLVLSDRENQVLSIQKVYDRSNSRDLWARFEYYELRMHIDAKHVERETDHPEFVIADLHASTARILAKEYAEANELPRHLIPSV